MAAAPAWLSCTGPINVFARTGYTGSAFYLGTCERFPVPEANWSFNEVMNDLGGNKVVFDEQFMGVTELIVLDLNRSNQTNLALIKSGPNFDGKIGVTSNLDRGSFVIQELNAFELWLQFTFFGTVNQADPGLPIGWYYPVCRLEQDASPNQGTMTLLNRIVIEAKNLFNPAGLAFLPGGLGSYFGFLLKSSNSACFAPLNGLTPA